jgi:RsmE family RNA methyltransferase
MNLLLLQAGEVRVDGTARLDGRRAAHLRDVLRVGPGRQVRVGLLDGALGTAVVGEVADSGVTLYCTFEDEPPPRPAVDLLLALPRPKVMRRLWAQLAAMGVGQIIVTNAARVERFYFDAHVLEPSVYHPLLIEGLAQARDTWLPRVSMHRQLKPLVEDHLDDLFSGTRLLAHPGAPPSIEDAVRDRRGQRALLAIGPEGGWNDFERDLLRAHGFQPVSVGVRTLRTDTACIALLAVAYNALRRCDP